VNQTKPLSEHRQYKFEKRSITEHRMQVFLRLIELLEQHYASRGHAALAVAAGGAGAEAHGVRLDNFDINGL
jgi:hypothetical protein